MGWTQACQVIDLLRKRLGLEEFFTIEKVFEREVGIEGVEIIGYEDGTVFTKTVSSVVKCELVIRKKEIIRKLNQYIGASKIKNIKIKIE
ncbi:MAG: DciA family protein [Endomicrobium sp.]|jgi:hypothetical protein|nr:DciA family protein [Endomicrobium sp.]